MDVAPPLLSAFAVVVAVAFAAVVPVLKVACNRRIFHTCHCLYHIPFIPCCRWRISTSRCCVLHHCLLTSAVAVTVIDDSWVSRSCAGRARCPGIQTTGIQTGIQRQKFRRSFPCTGAMARGTPSMLRLALLCHLSAVSATRLATNVACLPSRADEIFLDLSGAKAPAFSKKRIPR